MRFQLSDRRFIWAENQAVATARWGLNPLPAPVGAVEPYPAVVAAPVVAPVPWDLFIVGHGLIMKGPDLVNELANCPPLPHPQINYAPSFAVPAGITIAFYCDEGEVFDNSWEADVVSGAARVHGHSMDVDNDHFHFYECGAGSMCPEYILTFPSLNTSQNHWATCYK